MGMNQSSHFLKELFCSCLIFCSISTSAIAEDHSIAGISQERIKRLDEKFSAYISAGRYAGFTGLIVRDGLVAHELAMGWQDRERQVAMRKDSIFRIYSMSKAITSIAAMILYEEGHFQIDDPIDSYIPEFLNLRVYAGGEAGSLKTVPLQRPITFRDLFTHTSGLTYHFLGKTPVHKLYRLHGILPGVELLYPEAGDGQGVPDLKSMINALATIPLLHQPGERMSYGVSIDVLGHLIEIMSGQSLDVFLKERIFEPLLMVDTGFVVPENKLDRFAGNYSWKGDHLELVDDPYQSRYRNTGRILSAGAGLVSTSHDYMQFLLMILNGGKLGKSRILSPKTVDFILSNHFPKEDMPRPAWMKQQGHGLGFALALDPVRMGMLTSVNSADWAGAASTLFWLDRKERLAAVFMTQDMPIRDNILIEQVRTLSYQAILE